MSVISVIPDHYQIQYDSNLGIALQQLLVDVVLIPLRGANLLPQRLFLPFQFRLLTINLPEPVLNLGEPLLLTVAGSGFLCLGDAPISFRSPTHNPGSAQANDRKKPQPSRT